MHSDVLIYLRLIYIVGFLEDNNHIPRGVSGGKHEILGTGVVFDAE